MRGQEAVRQGPGTDVGLHGLTLHTHFQPIVRLTDGSIYGYEALTRGPAGSVAGLLEAFRRNGRLWELELACRRLAITRWVEALQAVAPGAGADWRLFVNVHPMSLLDPAFQPGRTRLWLQGHGLPVSAIVLELTEAVDLGDENAGVLERSLAHYRSQGFAVALDDMGTGHSSLTALVALRPDFVKIDRRLVAGVGSDPVRQHLVRGLVDAAHAACARVVAEGIESPEELRYLTRIGVDLGQGFLLGRPAPVLLPVPQSVRYLFPGSPVAPLDSRSCLIL